ncbi:MAG: class I adenylate-forming enzyme family protein [Acidimicrobiales bacterium]
MHLGMVFEMSADGLADRVAIGGFNDGVTFAELGRRGRRAGSLFVKSAGEHVVLVDGNSTAVPIALFGAAAAGKPFVPLNYRLADDRLRAIVGQVSPAVVIAGSGVRGRLAGLAGLDIIERSEFLAQVTDDTLAETDGWGCDPDAIAVLLFTSGTTGDPKAAVLRHRNLASYLVSSLEFGSAATGEAGIVSVPPYHIAAIASALSATYTGRRVVLLEAFDPELWVRTVTTESVTHAMVVPTMLGRILDVLEDEAAALPSLRSLAYGGGPMPVSVIERAMRMLPDVDLVNAYGLTETSSTIAVLGPEHHRAAFTSDDPSVRARLGSVGQPLPGVELTIRDPDGNPLLLGERGEIWVRGDQVSGEYLGNTTVHADGWFRTRDAGHLDEEGFLFVHGRLDDVIIRGGENLSPGEIEEVLAAHPSVDAAAVVGIPDVEWGERVVGCVVLVPGASVEEEELRHHVLKALRSARTPERIKFADELPYNESGKLLRRVLREELALEFANDPA